MEFTGERFIPSATLLNDEIGYEHLHRYFSAAALVKDKNILDIACGEGYGSSILAKNAKTVTGIDIDPESIKWATETYGSKHLNLNFICGNAGSIPVNDNLFDVVVSYETIEHLDIALQQTFLKEIKRVLRPGGILIISTPDKQNYTDRYNHINKFHLHEFYRLEFIEFLKQYFTHTEIFDQGYQITSIISNTASEKEDNIRIFNWQDEAADKIISRKYLIAIAGDAPLTTLINSFSSIIPTVDKDYLNIMDRVVAMNSEIESLGKWGNNLNKTIEEAKVKIDLQSDIILGQAKSIIEVAARNQRELEESQRESEEKQREKKEKQQEFEEKQQELQEKRLELEKKISIIRERDNNIQQLNGIIEGLKVSKKILLEKNEDLQQKIEDKEFLLEEVNQKVHQLFQEVNATKERLAEIYGSDGWKLLNKYYILKGKYLPEHSKLYKNLKIIYNKVPFKTKVKTFESIDRQRIIINYTETNTAVNNSLIPITLPVYEHPAVSIIIPAYNAWQINYQCISSIIKNTQGVAFEVIIADDCSTDTTKDCETIIKNIVHIRTEKNLGFLKNCNNAAKFAKGKYILFLNNDTTVNPNWLSPLVNLIERDESIGMVGAKFIYPDGQLQEAGGIIWQDASGWNYGHKQNPEAPEFNYVKEVDYISGACILIKKQVWEKAGGFDERYSPAYCEDSDLAFTLRSMGYKVMYQPLCEVIHFEGYSHGTTIDEDAPSIKSYQKINNTKFKEKWKDILQAAYLPNAVDVFNARDKTINKKTILVIDHYVPHFDKDAGSKTIFQYLELFVSLNLNIKFIGDNFFKHEPYTTILQQMGIEVLYGSWYSDNWKQWIVDNSKYIDFIFINRPHISIKYIDFLKENTHAQILYYGHDIHFIREESQYELQKDIKLLASAAAWKKTELYLFEKSTIILTPSDKENQIIRALNPSYKVETILPYFFKTPAKNITNFSERKSILFVGGFAHTPNLDAVEWFCKEVWPLVCIKFPTIKLEIVGSHPPENILQLQSETIDIKGFVSEQELYSIYSKARIAVIPLRYGAGVKGKTVEAMYNGLPIVTTSFGIEGMPGDTSKFVQPKNQPEEFANEIIKLYDDEILLKQISQLETDYINYYFTQASAAKHIKAILNLP